MHRPSVVHVTLAFGICLQAGAASVSHTDAFPWGPDGIPIATAAGAQNRAAVVLTGPDHALVTWLDARRGVSDYLGPKPDVYAQRITLDGQIYSGWPADGDAYGVGRGGPLLAAPDGFGGTMVVSDDVAEWGRYFLTHVRTMSWGQGAAPGVLAGLEPERSATGLLAPEKWDEVGTHHPVIAASSPGHLLVAWVRNHSSFMYGNFDFTVHLARIVRTGPGLPDVAAAPAIVQAGNAPLAVQAPALSSDGDGGAFLAWLRLGPTGQELVAMHVRADNTLDPAWPQGGRVVSGADDVPEAPGVVADGAGGVYVVWQARRGGLPARPALQHLAAGGSVAEGFPSGGLLLGSGSEAAQARTAYPGVAEFSLGIADGAGGAIVVWTSSDANGGRGVRAQRVTASGATSWPDGGLVICDAPGWQRRPAAVADGAGGMFVVWEDQRGGGLDIYGQHVLADGRTLLPDGGAPVCAAAGDQTEPAITGDGQGGALVVWTDARGGGADVYAARLRDAGTLAVGGPPRPVLSIATPRPNPAASGFTVGVSLKGPDAARLEVFDASGRRMLERRLSGGAARVVSVDAAGWPAGLYVIRLVQGTRAVSTKAIVSR